MKRAEQSSMLDCNDNCKKLVTVQCRTKMANVNCQIEANTWQQR